VSGLWIFSSDVGRLQWSASSVFKVQDYYVVFDIEYHKKVVDRPHVSHTMESSDDWEGARRVIQGLS
jgi:hypothetical protein